MKPGDLVRYKLSPSGVEGTCLLTEESRGGSDRRMFLGQEELKSKDVLDTRVVHLYPEDILYVYRSGSVTCRGCGRTWNAIWPEGTDELECPDCGELSGYAEGGI